MGKESTTEEKIKEAAKKVFQKKGLGLTRTRDIAEEAGINLALLNYYFRSKKKLFDIIMEESMKEMFSFITTIISDKETGLSLKIDLAVNRYIDVLLENPNLPLFVLSEIQADHEKLFQKIGIPENLISSSYMYHQIKKQLEIKSLHISPIQIFVNMISLSIFPILGKPLLVNVHKMRDEEYTAFINERRILIPIWIKSMLQLEE